MMRARGRMFSMRMARCFLGLTPAGGSALTVQIATDAVKPFFHVPFPTSIRCGRHRQSIRGIPNLADES
jgi:hypothetical protein